jgi:hypothetical protein
MVLNALTIRPKNTTTSAGRYQLKNSWVHYTFNLFLILNIYGVHLVQDTSLRGSKQLDNIGTADADTYTSKYGYFLQMQHETTECPPYGRMDGMFFHINLKIHV